MSGPIYLADTSAWVLRQRDTDIKRRFDTLLASARIASCQLVVLEWLNNASSPREYTTLATFMRGIRWLDVTAQAMDRAMEVHAALAMHSQHRDFSLADLIIAATAELGGATVLHYDRDYDRVAAITGQPMEWIVPRGSL